MAGTRIALIAIGLGLSMPLFSAPASAQPWSWTKCGTEASDFDAIDPAANKLLDEDVVGTSRPWSSTSGHSGHVTLLSGGTKAGSTEGRVRITKVSDGQERKLFTFKYRKTDHGWATCG